MPSAHAGTDLDVHEWLAQPGVRLLVVEFYATWCGPCMKAMPKWKRLHETYRSRGLRIVVVNTKDQEGFCRGLPFPPDQTVCDMDGRLGDAFLDDGALPAAFLWSWQKNLLVSRGTEEDVERSIERYLGEAHRAILEPGPGVGVDVVAAVSEALTDQGRIDVISGADVRATIEEAKRAQQGARYDEKYRCEPGKELPPNVLLRVSKAGEGTAAILNLALHDVMSNCQVQSTSVPWGASLGATARDAAGKLLAKLKREGGVQMPGSGPVKRQDKIVIAEDSKWRPTSNDPVLVRFGSQPAGARVDVDGNTLCPATPCKKMVEPGLRAIRMSAEKHVTRDERVRVDADEQYIGWKLDANTATVAVETGAVNGVPIVIDGEAAGKSPLRVDLLTGPHRIEINDPCYEAARADVAVERGAAKRVDLNGVPKTAGLRVELSDANDEPVQGDVNLDGVVVGRTWKTLAVPACSKHAEVQSGGGNWSQALTLRAQQTTRAVGKLGVKASPGMALIPGGDGVQAFSIDAAEVTVDSYAACVSAGKCSKPDDDGRCNWGKGDRGNHPVNCVDWDQAKAFCGWAQKRLPTEHEWQRAAQGARGLTYPWGEEAPSNQLCWDGEGSPVGKGNRQSTCAVRNFPAGGTAQGVHDLSGNVSEWTASCFDEKCSARVYRGGSWINGNPWRVRAAERDWNVPSTRFNFLGFRCSRSSD